MHTRSGPVVVGNVDKQETALTAAAHYARTCDVGLRVVHSVGPAPRADVDSSSPAPSTDHELAGQALMEGARTFLQDRAPDIEVAYVIATGPPAQALGREATTAGMVVVGADDVPWFERLFRSKVAGHLAMTAPCPVVVVPELERDHGTSVRTVLAIHGSDLSDGPIRFAMETVAAGGRQLFVLHTVPRGTFAADVELMRTHLSRALDAWRAEFPDVTVIETFPWGDASHLVKETAEAAGLVVVGRPADPGAHFSGPHPLTKHVLRHAQCPVAVVPSTYEGR